jgi:hypothetical protein
MSLGVHVGGHFIVQVQRNGDADAHGAVHVRTDSIDVAPRVLVAAGASASCADSDNNGTSGITGLTIRFVDVETRSEVIGFLTPSDGKDIEEIGNATLVVVGERLSIAAETAVRVIYLGGKR